jgi:hypothetical protein
VSGVIQAQIHERFFSKVSLPDPETGCMEWLAYKNPAGYGKFGATEGTVLAHRWVYAWANGVFPEELTIDHLCANRACMNLTHMEAVSNEENVRRGGLRRHGWDSGYCSKGHVLTEESTRGKKRRCRPCYREYMREWRIRNKSNIIHIPKETK